MRTVEVERFVQAPTSAVERVLDPAAIVEHEGSFTVDDVEERAGVTLVAASGPGLALTYRFEAREDGYDYEQEEDDAPLETMETTLTYRPQDEGTLLSAASTVSMGVWPRSITDRIAAWKRASELERALESIAEDAT